MLPQCRNLFSRTHGSPLGSRVALEAHFLPPMRAALPQIPDPSLPAANPSMVAAQSGQRAPAPNNPIPGSVTATLPTPTAENISKRGHIDGPFLSRGAVQIRLTWIRRLETKRRCRNTSKKQTMLVDHWPTLRPPSLPFTTQIKAYTPPLPGSLHSFGWRHDPNCKIMHDPLVWAEYPFEYSPPHSPMQAPTPAMAGIPPPLGCTHTPIPEEHFTGNFP
jgi:hypothetical protein